MIDVMGGEKVSTAYDGLYIVRFLELHSDPAHWVSSCLAFEFPVLFFNSCRSITITYSPYYYTFYEYTWLLCVVAPRGHYIP
jgi:hypothetical protein